MKKIMYLMIATAICASCNNKEGEPNDPSKPGGSGETGAITELVISNAQNAPPTSEVDEIVLHGQDDEVIAKASWNRSQGKLTLPNSGFKTKSVSAYQFKNFASDASVQIPMASVHGRKSSVIVGVSKLFMNHDARKNALY